MARRSDHSREELKELILETSWEIIGSDGFEGLTARRIATEIGYAPGTVYNLFKSMDDLYLQINGRILDLLYDVLADPVCNDPEKLPVKNIKKMASLYMDFAKDYRPYWLMLFLHRLPEGRKTKKWYQKKIDRLFTPLEEILASLFTARQAKKRKMAARVLWSSVHGLCFLQDTGKMAVMGDEVRTEKMMMYLIDTFISGIDFPVR